MRKGNAALILIAVVAVVAAVGFFWWYQKGGTMIYMNPNTSSSGNGVMVGGAMMTPSRDIVANAMDSKEHTTLVAALKTADLVTTLQGEGPYTVFAPTDTAFLNLPIGTVETLSKPENKAALTKLLTYHVIPGRYTTKELKDKMTIKSVQGEIMTFLYAEGKWWIQDATGNKAQITIADVINSNGVTFVVDAVLMTK